MLGWLKRRKASSPTVRFTPAAREQVLAVLSRQTEPAALRILVTDPHAAVPAYDMALEALSAIGPGDTLVDVDGVRVLVDAASLPLVDGATVDFASDPLRPGFLVEAPRPELSDDPLAAQVQHLLEHQINPSIASHGGHAELVGIKDDVVYVALGGGCQGCSMASVTLKQGIEQLLKQAIPRIKSVVDATDHAHGNNPFYSSEKGGESPFHQAAKA
jgi:Fe/S biogenesis protein NfuA